ncbi:GW dipeptide domain-containing protein [Lacicoccus qingdaonensis]|uniref:Bifunctional autolysin n=1 Tax=Lacicoccus qingdaonensis TaxID=576118 RepID=A0A1G9H7V6_9BACL|nr:GW dipeptide domain-containing protein [Salinicoccus qingdaonensis]SDL08955.1 bifunctional autolysin [Salinicoccus qingdaonensis]
MKYKNRLIIPTLITTSLLTSSLVANADEMTDESISTDEIEVTVNENDETRNGSVNVEEMPSDATDAIDDSDSTDAVSQEAVHDEMAIHEETVDDSNTEEITESNTITDTEENNTEDISQNDNLPETTNNVTDKAGQDDDFAENDTSKKLTNEKVKHESLDEVSKQAHDAKLISDEQKIEHISTDSDHYEDSTFHDTDEQDNQEVATDSTIFEDTDVSNETITDEDLTSNQADHESEARSFSAPENISTFSTMNLKPEANNVREVKSVNYATRIKDENNSGLYSPVTNNNGKNAERFLNQTLFISESTKVNGSTYYKILKGVDGPMQGWMKQNDLDLYNIFNHRKHNETLYVNSNHKNDYLLADPYGTSKQHVKKLKDTGSSTFNATETLKVGAVTYYYGTLGDSEGWITESRLTKQAQPKYSDARFAARIPNGNNNSGIYSPVTSNNSVSANRFNNSTLFITEQADYDGTTYYKIHNGLDGAMQGWMKKNDLQIFGLGKVRNHSGSYTVKHDDFDLYTDPYGNLSQRIGSLKNYKNTPFKAEKSIKIGATTHYYGSFGNQKGWISNAALTKYTAPEPPVSSPKVQTVKYNRSLNNVLNTQMSLSTKPQAWVNGGGWRNATRSEVRHFLDTSHQKGGAWDYTFLNLDQRQGISSSVLNSNLLNNKGILTNRGSAFSQAARQHSINEVYLISHAILETGHGSSQLAQGVKLDRNGNRSNNGTTYYNMYGIGAVDHNALLGGARYAQRMGWDTPEKAIIGGAGFVSSNYFARGQNTLYSMRWNPGNPGTYQYATDVNWAYATGRNLKNYYDQLGIKGQYFTRHTF